MIISLTASCTSLSVALDEDVTEKQPESSTRTAPQGFHKISTQPHQALSPCVTDELRAADAASWAALILFLQEPGYLVVVGTDPAGHGFRTESMCGQDGPTRHQNGFL